MGSDKMKIENRNRKVTKMLRNGHTRAHWRTNDFDKNID